MATKPKTTNKPAPKAAADEVEIEVGMRVKFLGYGEGVAEEDQLLTEGEIYEIVEIDGESGNPVVRFENPDFNPKKKETEDNPAFFETEALPDEIEIVEEEEAADPVQETAAAPAQGKGRAAAAKTPAASKTAAAKETPAKGAAASKAKTEPKAAASKPAAKTPAKKTAAAPEPKEEEGNDDGLPELENEDEEVLALVSDAKDIDELVGVAQELEASVAASEWKLGGVLYHLRKDNAHLDIKDEKGKIVKAYHEPGGFMQFMLDYFNIDYRKGMYLIEIYVNFTQAGIENPGEVVARIGWTKAQKIAKKLLGEDANVEELIELAEQNTVADLSAALVEQKEVGGTSGEKKTRVTLKFRMWEDEGLSTKAIIEEAQSQLALKTLEEALAHIVNEWATMNAGGTATKEAAPTQTKPKATSRAKANA